MYPHLVYELLSLCKQEEQERKGKGTNDSRKANRLTVAEQHVRENGNTERGAEQHQGDGTEEMI